MSNRLSLGPIAGPIMNRTAKRHPTSVNKGKDPIALVRKLVPDGELTDEDQSVLSELRSLGEPAIDELLTCALTPRASSSGRTGGGRTGLSYIDANATRAKAIYALAQLHAERAVEPILRALEATKPHTAERGFLGSCCMQLGALALEPALRLCKMSPLGPSDALLVLLAHLGVRDARVLELLTGFLPINLAGAASLLGIYGDSAALPALKALRDRARADSSLSSRDAEYLREAIAKLGGEPTVPPKTPTKSRPAAGIAPSTAAPKPQGRNDRCACGSGKKYKVCCNLRS